MISSRNHHQVFSRVVLLGAALLLGNACRAEEPDTTNTEASMSAKTSRWANPLGTWLVEVQFPPEVGVPPFQELLTFHLGGTVSETNASLHANSANPFFNFNGSDGYGQWRRLSRNRFQFSVLKLVFDGDSNTHIGYLRVSSVAQIIGGEFIQDAADSETTLIIGIDPATNEVTSFGGADAIGTRISRLDF